MNKELQARTEAQQSKTAELLPSANLAQNPLLNAVANKDKLIKICEQVAEDMENDAKEFDGKPFDGKTVATYFGYQGAAIAALANVIRKLVDSHCVVR